MEWSQTYSGIFRVFGCVAHVHIPDQHRIKLDNKSKRCVLLGVSDESKAYRLFDPISKKIITSTYVIFEEQKHWNWEKNEEDTTQDALDVEAETEEEAAENNDIDHTMQAATHPGDSNRVDTSIDEPQAHDNPIEGRVRRNRREPNWMLDYESGEGLSDEDTLNVMMTVTDTDPLSFEAAARSKKWRNAMMKEMESIEKNKTWELVDAPNGVKPIGVKWIFKTKFKENGEVDKFKARLVASLSVRCEECLPSWRT